MGQFSPAGLHPGSSHYYKQVFQLAVTRGVNSVWLETNQNPEWRKQEGEEGESRGDGSRREESDAGSALVLLRLGK